MTSNLKVLINNSGASVTLLQFIKKHLPEFKEMNVVFKFRKILPDECNEELVSALSRKGINRLPTLITPGGKSFVGNNAILALLNKNLNTYRASSYTKDIPHTKPSAKFEGGGELESYWNRMIAAGDERDDESMGENGSGQFDKRVGEQNRMRDERYGKKDNKSDSHANVPKRAGPPTRRPPTNNRGRSDDDEERYSRDPQDYDETLNDNITNSKDDAMAYDKFMPAVGNLDSTLRNFNMGDGDDNRMMSALLNNLS